MILKMPSGSKLLRQLQTPDFYNFCLREYRRPRLYSRVLSFTTDRHGRWQLSLLTRRQLLQRLYLCDTVSKYRDLTDSVKVSKEFAKTITDIVPKDGRKLVGVEPLTNGFTKECFEQLDCVWSLPTTLFDAMRVDLPVGGDLAVADMPMPITDVQTFIATLDDTKAERVDPGLTPLTFFNIVTARPENLKAVMKGDRAAPSTFFAEVLHTSRYRNELGELVVMLHDGHLGYSERVVNLDTRRAATPVALSLLTSWATTRTSSADELAPWVVEGINSAINLLPLADTDPAGDDVAVLGQTFRGNDAHLQTLIHLKDVGAVTGGTAASSMFVILADVGFTPEVVQQLVTAGAVVRTVNEFLEETYVMDPSALVPSMTREVVVHNPTSIIDAALPMIKDSQSKIALYLQLRRTGWDAVDAILPFRVPGAPKAFERRMIERSSCYFHALLSEIDIFARGSSRIIHGMTQGYYKCLLQLGTLVGFHEQANFLALKDREFEATLQLQ